MIRTRWHRAQEAIRKGLVTLSTAEAEAERLDDLPPQVFDRVGFEEIVGVIDSAPKFYFDEQVINALMDRPVEVGKSLIALGEAGITRLPFPYLLAEYDWGGPNIVLFSESHDEEAEPFRANAMQLHLLSDGREVINLSPQTLYASTPFGDDKEPDAAVVNWKARLSGWMQTTDVAKQLANKSTDYWRLMVQPGLVAVLVLLNTRGITRDLVHVPRKLNMKRAKKGKPPIPEHTVIRLGHVYRRDGTPMTAAEHSGWKQPLHLRAGYTANRWITRTHPKWDAEKADAGGKHTILVFVEPYLVNYDPASDELPDIPERAVTW